MPRKTCQLRLSRSSTKFDVLARFCETIPTVKSVSSSEIWRLNFGFLIEITISHFFQKLEFLGSYILLATNDKGMKDCSPSVAPIMKGDKLSLNQCLKNDLEKESMKNISYA